nr:MAG TPA: hypothetical protein [Caudoviricetes sp.]
MAGFFVGNNIDSDLFCKLLINKILQRFRMFPILQRY